MPGGLLALDDYFNPAFPGVCEGAIKFWLAHDGALTPVAAAFNKVLFQKPPAPLDLNAAFDRRFPYIPHKTDHVVGDADSLVQLICGVHRHTGIEPTSSRCPTNRFEMDAVLTFRGR